MMGPVVICTLNSKYIHSSLAPWCLLSGLREYSAVGAAAFVAEGTINEKTGEILSRILAYEPSVVGLSCTIWNIQKTLELVHELRIALSSCTVVLGGPEVSPRAAELLTQNSDIDYIIAGEGERPFALLVDALAAGSSPEAIPGLCLRKNGAILENPPGKGEHQPPDPYCDDYFKALKGRIAYLETSRGCPFSCAFCLSGGEGGVRYFDEEQTKCDLIRLSQSGAKTVKLVDRTFNSDRKRAYRLFRFLIEQHGKDIPKGVCFHFEIAGDLLDDETIALLRAAPAGLFQLEIGLQSFHEETLRAICRRTDTGLLKRNIRALMEAGNIHTHIDLIAGLPLEDLDTFRGSFNTAYDLAPHMLQLGFLKMLHGSPMRLQPDRYPCEYGKSPPYEVISTPWLTTGDIKLLKDAERELERLYNSGRFQSTLRYILGTTGVTPFDLFADFGAFTAKKETERMPLDGYTALVYDYFSALSGVDEAVLRDRMVCDRLSSNSSGRLPSCLRRIDPGQKAAITMVENDPQTRALPGVRRSYALLQGENTLVYADYRDPDAVTGHYQLHRTAPRRPGQDKKR